MYIEVKVFFALQTSALNCCAHEYSILFSESARWAAMVRTSTRQQEVHEHTSKLGSHFPSSAFVISKAPFERVPQVLFTHNAQHGRTSSIEIVNSTDVLYSRGGKGAKIGTERGDRVSKATGETLSPPETTLSMLLCINEDFQVAISSDFDLRFLAH
eukprot:g10783.t1